MPSLGNLWYGVMLKDMTDADLQKIQQKLENLGFKIDATKLRQQIEAGIGATPFNATVSFGNARASIDAALANTKGQVTVEAIASKLKDSIDGILAKHSTETFVKPKKKELRKAVSDALLSAGFEINIGKAKGVSLAVKNALGTAHDLKLNVDSVKLADSIDKALGKVKGKAVSVEARKKILTDSITTALKTEKFPIKVIVDKAEAQDAVRQALQAAGLQNSGFTASDKRAWDAQSRRMEAQARAAAANALAQRRLAGAHNTAQRATDNHIHSSVSLGSAMRGNIRIAGELGPMLASAYSVVVLKNFMQKVVEIGGELEQQKLAMKAILGDAGMANTISSQINTLAVKSPFGVMELNQYAKQLTAFQIPYNELYDTMKRMADVSAAVGVDMGRIILAYGQVRAAKFLKGTELRQFTEANIPMIDMLAQRFTKLKGEMVSAGDVMDMISNKEVTFEDVKAVLWELTGEGGKFYNMQEVLSESVKAKWKNLSDAVDLMFASIAESTASSLKSLAEILTELTRNWRTIALVVASGAIAFGLVKTASLLTARSLDASGTSALKAAANAALLERQNARLAQGYRMLTRDERKALQTSLPITSLWGRQKALLASLSGAQFRQLALTGQITKEEWSRMIALGRLNDVQKNILVQTGVLTQAELDNIRVLKGWKKWTLGVGNAMRGLGRSMLALVANPMTLLMAAVGAVTALWQRNSEEMQRAEEIGKNVATSASEGARNLKESLETIKPGEGLSDTQLTQGIEQMQQLIKDYSPTPIQDINNALVAQDGHVRTLIEQYTILRNRVEELANAHKGMDNTWMGDNIGKAMKATDGGNWFTQMFDDDIATNAKDYTDALGRVTDRISKYSREYANNMKNAVIAATNADAKFRNAVSGMDSYEEKLRYLAENADKYYNAATAFDVDMNRRGNGEHLDYFSNTDQIKAAREELLKDTDKFIADYNARMRQMGINPFLMTEGQKTQLAIALQSMLKQMEGAGEDAKALMAQKMEEAWGLTGMIIEDKIGPSMQEKFRTLVGQSTDEGVKSAVRKLQYEGYTALSDAEKELVDKLMNQAKIQTMGELGILNDKMQAYLTAHPLSQLITLSYTSDAPSDLAKELAKQIGYPALTESTDRNIRAWTKSNSVYDARNAAQSALQQAKNELDAAKKAGVGIEKAQKEYDEIWDTIQKIKWTDLATKDQNPKESQKDPLAESLKQRFKDIKDAWSEFQKWSKTEGREAAATRIGESGLFSTLSKDKIPQTVEQYRTLVVELENELRKAGVKGTARESLLNDLLKQLLAIDKTVVDEQLKLALDKVSKEAERQLADWQLFDKIRKATGNQDLAMSVAFGMNTDATTDYPKLIEQQLDKQAKAYEDAIVKKNKDYTAQDYTYASLKKLYDKANAEDVTEADMNAWLAVPEEIRKAWEKANGDIIKYFDQQRESVANILNEYQTLQDKIDAINAKRKTALETINAKDKDGNFILSDEERAKKSQTVNVKADWEIFTQSNDYLRFFNDIYGLTMDEANRIGDLIQLNLNQRLQDAQISAYDYEKEMEKVRKQLEALRNVKSDAMTFLTGGLKGLNQKKLQKAEGELANNEDYQKALKEQVAAQNALNKAQEEGDEKAIKAAEAQLALANQSVKAFTKIRDAIIADQEKMQNILDVANIAANITGGISDAFNSIRDMADALGFDTESNDWLNVGGVIDTLTSVTGGISKAVQSAMKGDIGGIISGTFDTLLSPITIWSKLHDKKLQKQIEEYQRVYDLLDKQLGLIAERLNFALGSSKQITDPQAERDKARYDEAVRRSQRNDSVPGMPSFYGSMYKRIADKLRPRVEAYETGGVYAYQRQLMAEQVASLTNQRNAEADKKDSDSNAIADYDNQIASLQQQIRDFAETTIETLYGINIRSWAEDIGSALIDAFARGEDAAEAFDKAVGDIMRDVVKQMAIKNILEKQFEGMRTYLFGADGMSGAFGADFYLDKDEVAGLKAYFDKIKETVPQIQELFDGVNEATGGLLDEDSSKSDLSAGIQGVTEDTADLLASYLNATRADVSEQTHVLWPRLLDDVLPQMNVIAESQLKMQQQIAANTLRNAIAAEAIVKSNDEINKLLARVTQGGAKFYIH